eukprot:TRINITY_DN23877_c0_g2_i1.p1 TRINITY_DN23877_c0_g2~~TRINITY_DN23877_c0_g2_i1.p1  ORF type:complete len:457 (+),score=79.00 TRINITY_DN23877_c0_g2_i1:171-1373(+)
MPLSVLRMGRQIAITADGTEACQEADDDIGRVVQWSLGTPQERWEVRFVFTHFSGPNGGSVLGIGFGTRDVQLEEVDIMADTRLLVCDAFDGEVNALGQEIEGVELSEPASLPPPTEESITAVYDSQRGHLRFAISSPRLTGSSVVEMVKDSLKGLELYPTAAFAKQRSKVRVEVRQAKMQMPVPVCPRLVRMDLSEYLDAETCPCGRVTFRVDGRTLRADRFLLAARSEYFETMLRSAFPEGREEEISIPSASFCAFEAVLRFVYSAGQAGSVLFKEADPLEVLHLAVEFLLDDLVRLCEWKLLQGLTEDSSLATFGAIASVRAKVPTLAEACVERLRGRMSETCMSLEFRELCKREDVVRELFVALDEPNVKRRRVPGASGRGGSSACDGAVQGSVCG